jgi:heparin/heparan-sulfate lyase
MPHPRVFFGPSDVNELRSRWNHPDVAMIVEPIRAAARDGHLEQVSPSDEPVGSLIPACQALVAVLENDRAQARRAVCGMLRFLSSYDPLSGPAITVNWGRIGVGNAILHAAMVYDWAYCAMSGEDRTDFITKIRSLAAFQEIGYPSFRGSAVVGHAGERELLCNLLAAGIAIFDEHPEMLRLALTRILDDYAPARRLLYRSGRHSQGTSYQAVRFYPEILATTLLHHIGMSEAFGPDQRRVAYHWLYQRLPNGQLLLDGDVGYPFKHAPGEYWASSLTMPTLLAAAVFSDPYLQTAGLRMLNEPSTLRAAEHDKLLAFFSVDPFVPAAPLHQLPLVHFTDDPLAGAIARTGWDLSLGSRDTVVEMKIGGIHFSNHQHLDAGSFQIFSPGSLVVESGLYTYRGYASDHQVNYAKRTIAHNCLLIHDSDERPVWKDATRPVANDGGQRWPRDAVEPADVSDLMDPRDPARVASLRAADTDDPASPSYVHLAGDLAAAYGKKAHSYRRSFVLLYGSATEPVTLLVRDIVMVRDASLSTTWVMHTTARPVWRDGMAVVEPVQGKNRGLVIQPIDDAEGRYEALVIDEAREDFPVGRSRFPSAIAPEQIPDCFGTWRLSLSRPVDGVATEYLVALTVTETGLAPPFRHVPADGAVLVRHGDRLVGFGPNGDLIDQQVIVRLSDRSVRDCVLTDLAPGRWLLTTPDGLRTELLVRSGAGTARITQSPSNFSLSPLNSGEQIDWSKA